MAQGTVKWFNTQKGFGYITPDNGSRETSGSGQDVFVHSFQVAAAGLANLEKGQRVEYEQKDDGPRPRAVNIKLLP